jgi:hypothetical protein
MTRRSIFFGLAAGLVALGLGNVSVRAGELPLPTTLDQLLTGTGNYATEAGLSFSDFTYSTSNGLGGTAPPPASGVNVLPFDVVLGEPGITLQAAFAAPPGGVADYSISFTVSTKVGVIHDAFLSFVGGNFGGNGSVSIGESIYDANTGALLGTMDTSLPGSQSALINFDGVTSIRVQKDIFIMGGNNGATVSLVNQGFSVVPEPASMALLGIGLSGLLTFRRFRRRAAVA